MALKSYSMFKKKGKREKPKFIKKPLETGVKLGLGFLALGLGLSALDRV